MSLKISVIVPVLNEQQAIGIFLREIVPVLQSLTFSFEIIFVDDGSTDDTVATILEHQKHLKDIRVITLSRNFGKEAALTAGLEYALGDVIVPMDVDLQDPPGLLPLMLKRWQEGYDVVLAKRIARDKDGALKKNTARLFYWFWNKIADTNIPNNVGDFRLFDKKVLQALKTIPEKNRFMKGIFSWIGFKSSVVEFERPERSSQTSRLSYIKLYNLAMNGIFAFTAYPLKIWIYVGLCMFLVAFGAILYCFIRALMFGMEISAHAYLMMLVLLMGSMNMLGIGVMGQYVARIYEEVKNRPIYIVDKIYEPGGAE